MDTSKQTNAFLRLISDSQKIVLMAPKEWNGDVLVSLLALQSFLSSLGKDVIALGPESTPFQFSYLNTESILHSIPDKQNLVISLDTSRNKIKKIQYRTNENNTEILIIPELNGISPEDISFRKGLIDTDLIITLGASSRESLGLFFEENTELFDQCPIAQFSLDTDTDISETVSFISPQSSSIAELLFHVLSHHEAFTENMTPDIATLFLTGIISQTESFLEPNTKSSTFEAASKLYSFGAQHTDIINQLFKMKKFATLKAWGFVLNNLEVDSVHRIAWSSLNSLHLKATNAESEAVEEVNTTLIQYVKDVDFALLFRESGTDTFISLRSQNKSLLSPEFFEFFQNTGTPHPHGIDFVVPHKRIVEIQFEFLSLILQYQKNRLGIPADVPLQTTEIEKNDEKKNQKSMRQKTEKTVQAPKAPSNIPFELFETVPAINTLKPNTEKSLEKTKEEPLPEVKPSNSIPEWLKKKD